MATAAVRRRCFVVNYRRPRWTDPSPSLRRQHRRMGSRTSSHRSSYAIARSRQDHVRGAYGEHGGGRTAGRASHRLLRGAGLGGAGMIVVEPVPTHRTAVLTRGNFRHGDDAVIPHFRRLTEAVHEAAATTIIQQLYHVGQHGDAENSFAPNWSPSGLPSYHDADGSHRGDRIGDRGVARRLRRRGVPHPAVGFRRHRAVRCLSRLDRPVLDPVVEPLHQVAGGVVHWRTGCGSVARSWSVSAGRAAKSSSSGLAVSVDPESPASLGLADVQGSSPGTTSVS